MGLEMSDTDTLAGNENGPSYCRGRVREPDECPIRCFRLNWRLRLLSFRQCELAHTKISPIGGIRFSLLSLGKRGSRCAARSSMNIGS
jgi:hypothetical protein